MNYYDKDSIYYDLNKLNNILKTHNLYLNLKIVGGSALIFNGIHGYETEDIDTLERIEENVKEILDDLSIDINDDVLDFIDDFDDCEFIENDKQFSNINIMYLDLGYAIKQKLMHSNPDKANNLAYLFEMELNVDLNKDSIIEYLNSLNVKVEDYIVEEFLEKIEEF